MDVIYFNAHRIKGIRYLKGDTMSDIIRSLGFNSIRYHPDSLDWDHAWSMKEKEYLMLVMKHGP